jgi:lipid-binding SYLF domain-containing protein
MELTKGSVGLQAGVQSTELVLMIMNRRGLEKLLSNKVTLGADASIAAGPVGRTASAATDAQMTAEMLSYSRSKGLFAGIDLSGGSLRPDKDANVRAYGAKVTARDVTIATISRVSVPSVDGMPLMRPHPPPAQRGLPHARRRLSPCPNAPGNESGAVPPRRTHLSSARGRAQQ